MTVSLSMQALHSLDEIREWNCQAYGVAEADIYIAFLLAETKRLERIYFVCKTVSKVPRFRYTIIRRRSGGHGHIAVFEIIGDVIQILQFYHTAQDWQTKLIEGLE